MDESQIMRIPPHNIEAEQSVIGAIIMDHEALICDSSIDVPLFLIMNYFDSTVQTVTSAY